jgi:hypothetical protein
MCDVGRVGWEDAELEKIGPRCTYAGDRCRQDSGHALKSKLDTVEVELGEMRRNVVVENQIRRRKPGAVTLGRHKSEQVRVATTSCWQL